MNTQKKNVADQEMHGGCVHSKMSGNGSETKTQNNVRKFSLNTPPTTNTKRTMTNLIPSNLLPHFI